jgi:hypothetical protein
MEKNGGLLKLFLFLETGDSSRNYGSVVYLLKKSIIELLGK